MNLANLSNLATKFSFYNKYFKLRSKYSEFRLRAFQNEITFLNLKFDTFKAVFNLASQPEFRKNSNVVNVHFNWQTHTTQVKLLTAQRILLAPKEKFLSDMQCLLIEIYGIPSNVPIIVTKILCASPDIRQCQEYCNRPELPPDSTYPR